MHAYHLASLPCFLDNRRVPNIRYLLDHVQFAEPVYSFFSCGKPQQFGEPSLMEIANVSQPIVDQPVGTAFQSGSYSAAAVMTTNDDMFDLQDLHRVLQHREAIHIGMNDKIGDIAVHEQFSGPKADDFVGGNSTIGAPYPEKLRALLAGKRREKRRI